jgi:hypothetical protein
MRPSNRRNLMLANPMIAALAMLLMLGCTDQVHAQGKQIESLGRSTVGSQLAEVQSLKRSENCIVEGGNADCTFADTNGVSYVVLEGSVTAVTATEGSAGSGLKLPFGLKFGDSLDAAAKKLVSDGKTWVISADPDTSAGLILGSSDRYAGKNGWDFNVEVRFESGKLVGISYNAGTI